MIAEMEQTGSTHSSAEIKRKVISNSMLIIANMLHNLLQMLFTEFLKVYGTLMQKKNSLIPAISPCNMLSFEGKAQKECSKLGNYRTCGVGATNIYTYVRSRKHFHVMPYSNWPSSLNSSKELTVSSSSDSKLECLIWFWFSVQNTVFAVYGNRFRKWKAWLQSVARAHTVTLYGIQNAIICDRERF